MWQDIETAPKDVEWRTEEPFEFSGDNMSLAFSDDDDATPLFLVWHSKTDYGYRSTKWHPLPPPPEST